MFMPTVCSKPRENRRDFRFFESSVGLLLIVLAISFTAFVILDSSDEADATNIIVNKITYNLNDDDGTATVLY